MCIIMFADEKALIFFTVLTNSRKKVMSAYVKNGLTANRLTGLLPIVWLTANLI